MLRRVVGGSGARHGAVPPTATIRFVSGEGTCMSGYISVLDLFSIGIGPSSSHTVGPMRAAREFAGRLAADGRLAEVASVGVVLYGSLGATGIGHGTPDAVVAGLRGAEPETCDPAEVRGAWTGLAGDSRVRLLGTHEVPMVPDDVRLAPLTLLPAHSNGMRFTALSEDGGAIREDVFYSIGGGFVVPAEDDLGLPPVEPAAVAVPYPFASAAQLLERCEETGLSIAEVARANEIVLHGERALDDGLDAIWRVMSECIDTGLAATGTLPGGLGVVRRAAAVAATIREADEADHRDTTVEWLHAYAMAVNEENASGGRVVTAPTNGAAGIIPAVLRHAVGTIDGIGARQIREFLLTAGAVGSLYKANASISGAEAGCQGEVGPACSMAAAGLCALLAGTPAQVENAAEIAMEHNLGLTCDPVAGLVQVPCIERNAIAATTALSAARMACCGDGSHLVSLDMVIETMRQVGLDMSTKYKETSMGGLAVNVIEC